jgi:tetratricopeptide (TPR) repeat protein
LIGLGVVAIGGLDVQVLSQAPTSARYRLQYWHATARMIADHPLLGIGPGQFQQYYARYKLPEASETIADPHNFLLEIWSTAGSPALVALLALAGCFVWQLSRSRPDDPASNAQPDSSARFVLYAGGTAGLLLAFPIGLVVGYPPSLVGFPAALAAVWLLDAWVVGGRMPVALPVIALLALLINLLAAGATSFPGVFMTAWILIPLALAHADAPAWVWRPSRSKSLPLLAAALVLLVLCARTHFTPVLGAASHLAQAENLMQSGRPAPAEQMLVTAARLDPWSPAPWRSLAELRLQKWLQTGTADDWLQFMTAAMEYRQRDPHHHAQFTAQGNWLLVAWRNTDDPRPLETAIDAYRQAAAWYPNRAIVHAQLAWALHLAGRTEEAKAEAELALELDARHDHREQKLSQQTIYDPQKTRGPAPQDASTPPPSAEQIVRRLRTGSGTPPPP